VASIETVQTGRPSTEQRTGAERALARGRVPLMLALHAALAVAVVAVAFAGAAWGFLAYKRPRTGNRFLNHLLTLAQTLLIAQVAIGLVLLSQGREARESLHYGYGTLALAAVLAPWLYAPPEPRRRLLWFAAATLLAAALATRAYTTGA
jgi:hypothetical protein